jgi:hypothetical protein
VTILRKGGAAEKSTTGSSYIALGRNARKRPLLALTLELDDITAGANRTENTIPGGIRIMTRVTFATLTWCFLCCSLVTAISLSPLFRLSSVMSQYFPTKILYAFLFSPYFILYYINK